MLNFVKFFQVLIYSIINLLVLIAIKKIIAEVFRLKKNKDKIQGVRVKTKGIMKNSKNHKNRQMKTQKTALINLMELNYYNQPSH